MALGRQTTAGPGAEGQRVWRGAKLQGADACGPAAACCRRPGPHRVWHLSLKELLGVQAETLARAGAPRAACTLSGLHPAARKGSRHRCRASGHTAAASRAPQSVTQGRPSSCSATLGCLPRRLCRYASVKESVVLRRGVGWLCLPADGGDPQGVHACARVVLFLLHHAAVNHIHHAVHWQMGQGLKGGTLFDLLRGLEKNRRLAGAPPEWQEGAQQPRGGTRLLGQHRRPNSGMTARRRARGAGRRWPSAGRVGTRGSTRQKGSQLACPPAHTCHRRLRNVRGHNATPHALGGGREHAGLRRRTRRRAAAVKVASGVPTTLGAAKRVGLQRPKRSSCRPTLLRGSDARLLPLAL